MLSTSISLAQVAPSFQNNFANYLTNETPDEFGRVETVFSLCIDRNATLADNIRRLFFPNPITYTGACAASAGGELRDVIRVLWFGVLFIFLVRNGILFLFSAENEDRLKKARNNILFIISGAFLLFGSTWILGSILNIGDIQGTQELTDRLEQGILFQILAILKAAAFFTAIIMLIVYAFKMMAAMDYEDKVKTAGQGILRVILALIFIKVIDYVFVIAAQPDFASTAQDFIIQIATVLGYIFGAIAMIMVFYTGFLLLTSYGNEERVSKAKNVIITIVLSAIVIFLFLLIIYQVLREFT